jgi:hypothetical protein
MKASPIAVFVFKRPEHTAQMLASLLENAGLEAHPLYIFCDAARHPGEAAAVDAVRAVVDGFVHAHKTVIKQVSNQGLARSIIHGVTKLCEEYGQVIVLEDDLVLAPQFLNYMQQALVRYADEPRVMQISGHNFPVSSFAEKDDAMLLPFVGSWGWATWSRAWKRFDAQAQGWDKLLQDRALRKRFDLDHAYPYTNMLMRQMRGEIDSWAIRWNWSVFKADGLVLYPSVSLVDNIGFDGSGTHCATDVQVNSSVLSSAVQHPFPDAIGIDAERFQAVRASILHSQGSWLRRTAKRARHLAQRWGI